MGLVTYNIWAVADQDSQAPSHSLDNPPHTPATTPGRVTILASNTSPHSDTPANTTSLVNTPATSGSAEEYIVAVARRHADPTPFTVGQNLEKSGETHQPADGDSCIPTNTTGSLKTVEAWLEPPDEASNYNIVSSKSEVPPNPEDAQPRTLCDQDLDKLKDEIHSRPRSAGGPNLKSLKKRTLKEYKEQKEWASHFRCQTPPSRRPNTPPTPEWHKPEPKYDRWGVLIPD